MDTLTQAQLNRTLLHRQKLLEPSKETLLKTISSIAGLQAQEGPAPYFGLNARVHNFKPEHLDVLRLEKKVIRCTLQRRTVHLVTTDDYLSWRPLYQERIEREIHKWGPPFERPHEWLPKLQEALGATHHSNASVSSCLKEVFSNYEDLPHTRFALMAALELVRVPGEKGEALGPKEKWMATEEFLGQRPGAGDFEGIIRSYLSAFGPATAGDMSYWSGLTGIRAIMESMEDELWTGKNEAGKKLYDVEEKARLSGNEDTPRVTLLADFDNLILGHQDRTRIISDEDRSRMNKDLRSMNPILVDGYFAGLWKIRKNKTSSAAIITTFRPIAASRKHLLEAKAKESLLMWQPNLDPVVTWE